MSPSPKEHVSSKTTLASILNNSPIFSILLTLFLVIIVRESAVLFCDRLGFASAGNIVGMISMFILLVIWRFFFGLPSWLTGATSTLLLESGFAFLPVSAGAGLLLFDLGSQFWGFMATILISTLLPLWGIATLANFGFSRHNDIQDEQ